MTRHDLAPCRQNQSSSRNSGSLLLNSRFYAPLQRAIPFRRRRRAEPPAITRGLLPRISCSEPFFFARLPAKRSDRPLCPRRTTPRSARLSVDRIKGRQAFCGADNGGDRAIRLIAITAAFSRLRQHPGSRCAEGSSEAPGSPIAVPSGAKRQVGGQLSELCASSFGLRFRVNHVTRHFTDGKASTGSSGGELS